MSPFKEHGLPYAYMYLKKIKIHSLGGNVQFNISKKSLKLKHNIKRAHNGE